MVFFYSGVHAGDINDDTKIPDSVKDIALFPARNNTVRFETICAKTQLGNVTSTCTR